MTKSTITDERVTSVIERLEHYACNLKWTNVRGAQDLLAAADGLRELQERRKADSEPVGIVRYVDAGFKRPAIHVSVYDTSLPDGTELFTLPQPAPIAPVCTCPSGDGSLRWPCPVHPANSPVMPEVLQNLRTIVADPRRLPRRKEWIGGQHTAMCYWKKSKPS